MHARHTTDRILRVSNIMIYSGTNIYITLSLIIAIEYDNFIVEDKATRFICHCITLKFGMIRLCCVFFGHSVYLCARVYFVWREKKIKTDVDLSYDELIFVHKCVCVCAFMNCTHCSFWMKVWTIYLSFQFRLCIQNIPQASAQIQIHSTNTYVVHVKLKCAGIMIVIIICCLPKYCVSYFHCN